MAIFSRIRTNCILQREKYFIFPFTTIEIIISELKTINVNTVTKLDSFLTYGLILSMFLIICII